MDDLASKEQTRWTYLRGPRRDGSARSHEFAISHEVELGIPDIIHSHGQPMTLSELISALQIHPSKSHHVYRLMRILVHSGFFSLQKLDDNRQSPRRRLLAYPILSPPPQGQPPEC
ncbi:hypothetical protein GH714_043624 [Hevea brasiliensis]|uniref:O-methyltransferase dimerisation domain-containing protein n=1 Tax=Hevea brasiliensis TaxID=3981 RepID=A0A6A6K3G7_HEVBR|nr:hypothetical protein GH714_043624 [Hevea brasiliensis]